MVLENDHKVCEGATPVMVREGATPTVVREGETPVLVCEGASPILVCDDAREDCEGTTPFGSVMSVRSVKK